jgi:hypothetical protein
MFYYIVLESLPVKQGRQTQQSLVGFYIIYFKLLILKLEIYNMSQNPKP